MSRTILVIDDEPELVASCERVLRRAGYQPVRAHTGLEAIELMDWDKPRLVVTDFKLPGADGLAVARHARAQVPPIPVILMTGYDSEHVRQAARECGVDVYLPKPFSNAAFLEAVRRVWPSSSIDEVGSRLG